MEYDPKQLEILMHKVAFTLGSNLKGLLFQQKNILDNHLLPNMFWCKLTLIKY